MAVKYDIKAKPTVYGGRVYRSRLEAKWAAFFDRLGWRHEYEPLDLGTWSPDFALVGAEGKIIYAEVKPIAQFDHDVAEKMVSAAPPGAELVLLGLSPFWEDHASYQEWLFLGWYGQLCGGIGDGPPSIQWGHAPFAWYHAAPEKADFTHDYMSFTGALGGTYDGGSWGRAPHRFAEVWSHWADATNAVQWRAR